MQNLTYFDFGSSVFDFGSSVFDFGSSVGLAALGAELPLELLESAALEDGLSFFFISAEPALDAAPEGGVLLDPEADEDPDGLAGAGALDEDDPVAARDALGPDAGLSQP